MNNEATANKLVKQYKFTKQIGEVQNQKAEDTQYSKVSKGNQHGRPPDAEMKNDRASACFEGRLCQSRHSMWKKDKSRKVSMEKRKITNDAVKTFFKLAKQKYKHNWW